MLRQTKSRRRAFDRRLKVARDLLYTRARYRRFSIPAAAGRPSRGEAFASGNPASACSGTGEVLRRVWIGICLGALMPKRTLFLPTSNLVISISSATMIFWSFLRLMISMQPYLSPYKCSLFVREIQGVKNTAYFALSVSISQIRFNYLKFSGRIVAN